MYSPLSWVGRRIFEPKSSPEFFYSYPEKCLVQFFRRRGVLRLSEEIRKFHHNFISCRLFLVASEGVRMYTHVMTLPSRVPQALKPKRMVLDCRDIDFSRSPASSIADSLIAWVTSFPQYAAMHVYLPSSLPEIRRLQCTLQGLGCAVSRVTKCLPPRL